MFCNIQVSHLTEGKMPQENPGTEDNCTKQGIKKNRKYKMQDICNITC